MPSQVNLRPEPSLAEWLDQRAARWGVSAAEAARRVLREAMNAAGDGDLARRADDLAGRVAEAEGRLDAVERDVRRILQAAGEHF